MKIRSNPRFPLDPAGLVRELGVLWRELFERIESPQEGIMLKDGVTAPSTVSGAAVIYVDSSSGDLKIVFGDGTVKTIVVDT